MNIFNTQISELGNQLRQARDTFAAEVMTMPADKIDEAQAHIDDLQKRYDALQSNAQRAAARVEAAPAEEKSLKDMLASNEYARAFCYAVKNGIRPGRGQYTEQVKPLYDALTIAGGSPAGTDGGFLVPEDIDHTIREYKRSLGSMSSIFNTEQVSTNSGWRVVDAAPTTGFTALTSEVPAAGIAMDDQPSFSKVPFSLTTYGLIIPVSNELANDEVANLMGYLGAWFAKKLTITENIVLRGTLSGLSETAVSANYLKAISNALNKELDPAISATAAFLTNQTGFALLDELEDTNKRPLLQPDVASATMYRIKGRPVYVMSDATLPNDGSGKAPMYIGNFKEYATLFTRQPLEITSTDVGGNAFRSNSIEVRGIARMSASVFDSAAVVAKRLG